jgi:hypothetical protein
VKKKTAVIGIVLSASFCSIFFMCFGSSAEFYYSIAGYQYRNNSTSFSFILDYGIKHNDEIGGFCNLDIIYHGVTQGTIKTEDDLVGLLGKGIESDTVWGTEIKDYLEGLNLPYKGNERVIFYTIDGPGDDWISDGEPAYFYIISEGKIIVCYPLG